MSHSRSKGHRPQKNQGRTPATQYAGEGSSSGRNYPGSQNYGEQDYGEQERFGGQGGYGGSQGAYGPQGGYRAINFADRFGNPRAESDFQGSREFRLDPRYRGEMENRWKGGQDPEYREDQREREYRQWGNDSETDGMHRDRWDGETALGQAPERQRIDVTRFGQRWNNESSSQRGAMSGRPSFAGRGPQGYKRSDERISEDINEELTQDPELDAADISIEVNNGEIVLKGTVPDRESKRRAEEIAESCSGVKEVMNQLRVKREDSSDSENASRREKSEDKRNKAVN